MILPIARQLVNTIQGNDIYRRCTEYEVDLNDKDVSIVSTTPFVIECNGERYCITSNISDICLEEYQWVLLVNRKPTRALFNNNKLKGIRWIKHPSFSDITPYDIVNSWGGKFFYKKEDHDKGLQGLRIPQLGAIYAYMSYNQHPKDRGIIVMPTGTGKTETMLSILVANQCNKLLVVVPSDALRTQTARKFETLGILKQVGAIASDCLYPNVAMIKHSITDIADWDRLIDESNVIITTMNIISECSESIINLLSHKISHIFIDEAHHSEAITWKNFIEKIDPVKVTLFTATPFRNDGKRLRGEFIYNFPLKEAQSQQYYKTIKFIPIREYNKETADMRIAESAISQLRLDIQSGYNHIVMARCATKKRALEVFEYYKQYKEFSPVVIYSGMSNMKQTMLDIQSKKHKIIVCVNMLGEGFDLPELKIAAIHDERQSIPITLQFIGRFTRTSYKELGNASFITNIAYPPIDEELRDLYAKDADWNALLPLINDNNTAQEVEFKDFISSFDNIDNSIISLQNVQPSLSTTIYRITSNTWNPHKWKEVINMSNYDYHYSSQNQDTLIIVLGRKEAVDWGRFDDIYNVVWGIIVMHWEQTPKYNHVYINTSIEGISCNDLVQAIFGDSYTLVNGEQVFRAFYGVSRLSVMNFGARKVYARDVMFQSFFGRGVQDGLSLTEQGKYLKNNIFGVGYRDGKKISIGCSLKGKIWSYMKGNIKEYIDWCKLVGKLVADNSIDPNIVLQNTLSYSSIDKFPNIRPLSIEWSPDMFIHADNYYQLHTQNQTYTFYDAELIILDSDTYESIEFALKLGEIETKYIMSFKSSQEQEGSTIDIEQKLGPKIRFSFGRKSYEDICQYFIEYPPIIYYANGAQSQGTIYVELKNAVSPIAKEFLNAIDWQGVSLHKESQGIYPYEQDSIQYFFAKYVENDFDILYDDDGSGEIADLIGFKDSDTCIEIHLYHLKYATGGVVSNQIGNFYEVCGQAQKSLRWKDKSEKGLFDHLFARKIKKYKNKTCSRLLKGDEDDLEKLAAAAKWKKEVKLFINIVQPSLSKTNASDDILILLGGISQYLKETGNVDLRVYCSE